MTGREHDVLTPPAGCAIDWYRSDDGALLRWLGGIPAAAQGTVVFLGGRTSFVEMQFDVCRDVLAANWAVTVPEWRGHGLSGRLLANRDMCHIDDFRTYVADVRAFIEVVHRAGYPQPVHLVGYSMGGLVALMVVAEADDDVASMSLLSPMLGLHTAPLPEWATRLVARAAVLIGRGNCYVSGRGDYDPSERDEIWPRLTSDAAHFDRSYAAVEKNRDLAVAGPTWGWLDAAFRAIRQVSRDVVRQPPAVPTLAVLAAQDLLVKNAAARRVLAGLPHIEFVEIVGARHNLLIERELLRQQALDAVFLHMGQSATGARLRRDPEAP